VAIVNRFARGYAGIPETIAMTGKRSNHESGEVVEVNG
jgi:hypothetical protein